MFPYRNDTEVGCKTCGAKCLRATRQRKPKLRCVYIYILDEVRCLVVGNYCSCRTQVSSREAFPVGRGS